MAKLPWSALRSCLKANWNDRVSPHRRRIKRPSLAAERLERPTPAAAGSFGFRGLNYDPSQGVTPPDTIMSAGPTYVVEGVNDSLLFINKATIPNNITGTVQSFNDFFPGMTHSIFGFLDVITDPSVN